MLPRGLANDAKRGGVSWAEILIAFVVLAILAALFPFTGDDWAWGSSIGIERLQSGFADYNGRYVGNLLVLLLTRAPLLKALLMSAVMVGLAYGVGRFVDEKNRSLFWLSLLMIGLMPISVRAQGLVWTSGFTNYAVPALGVVLYANCFKEVFSESYRPNKKLIVPLFLLGAFNSLIMENITIYNVFAGLGLLVFTRLKHGIWDRAQIAFVFGSILGAALMFTNGAYTKIAAEEDGYRSMASDNPVKNAIKLYFSSFAALFCFDNVALNCAISVCAIIVLLRRFDDSSRVVRMCLVALFALVIAGSLTWFFASEWLEGLSSRCVGLLAALYAVGLLGLAVLLIRRTGSWKMMLLLMSILALLLPLFVVTPVGPRNSLPIYILFIAVLALLWDEAGVTEKLGSALMLLTTCCFAWWFVVYGTVFAADADRLSAIEEAVSAGDSAIQVERLPYPGSVWTGDPIQDLWEYRYKLFHGIPEDFSIECE